MSSPLFPSFRFRPNDHQPQDNPDAGLPPPVLAMFPKAQGKTKKHSRSHGHRGRRSSGSAKKEKEVARPQAGREAEKEVEAQQSPSQAASGSGKERRTLFHVHWARFKKRIGTGSAVSDSLIDAVESVSASATDASLRQRLPLQPGTEARVVAGVNTEKGNGVVQGKHAACSRVRVDEEPVDEIVVDNVFLNGERGGSVTHTASHAPSEAPHQNSGTTTTPGTVRSGVYQGFNCSAFLCALRLILVTQRQNPCRHFRVGTPSLC